MKENSLKTVIINVWLYFDSKGEGIKNMQIKVKYANMFVVHKGHMTDVSNSAHYQELVDNKCFDSTKFAT